MGLSTAYHLLRRGCRNVALVEREDYLGGLTTSRCAGGFRHQFSTEINVLLSLASIRLLESLEEELDCHVDLHRCGYLFALTGDDDIEAFEHAVALQRRLGVDTQWLPGDALRERFPRMSLDDVVAGTYHDRDGLVDPSGVVGGYAAACRRMGALVVTGTPVVAIGVEGGSVRSVVTKEGEIATPVVVNAAGPWAARIGKMAGVNLPIEPTHQQLFTTGPLPDLSPDLPVVIFPFQGLGFHREGEGILTGMTGSTVMAQAFYVYVDRTWEALHRDAVIERLPGVENARIVSRWAGLYGMTPDLHPILGCIPAIDGFYCIAGFSGHGLMHGPISGLLLSEEIVDGTARSIDIGPLRIGRFDQEQNVAERYVI